MTLELASTVGIRTLRVTLLDTRLLNPCEAWGQTLQFRQQTQEDNTRDEMFLRTYVTGSSVPDPPCVASYYCLCVYSLSPTDIKKEPPSTSLLLAVKLDKGSCHMFPGLIGVVVSCICLQNVGLSYNTLNLSWWVGRHLAICLLLLAVKILSSCHRTLSLLMVLEFEWGSCQPFPDLTGFKNVG
jgi:hypothetical protein